MSLTYSKKINQYILIYLMFILISSIFFINKTYLLEVNNSMSEWVINYEGGFGRRGLLGQLFLIISSSTGIFLKKIILFFIFFIFIFYYFLIYLFFKNLNFNNFYVFIFFSPIFLIFPIAELEALARKDMLIPLFFLVFCFLYTKFDFKTLSFILLISFTPLLLIHEVSIFYLPYFYMLIFFKLKTLKISYVLLTLTMSVFFLYIIYLLSNSIHSLDNINHMCEILKNNYDTKCGLGASVLNRSLSDNISELFNLKLVDVFRGIWIFFLGSLFLIISIINSEYNNSSVSFIFSKINFQTTLIISFIPTLIPFFIAVDWGRWFNLSYTMLVLLYFFCIKNKLINFKNTYLITLVNQFLKNKIFFITLLFLFCFSWNPKAVYHEDIGSFPIYRILNKIITH